MEESLPFRLHFRHFFNVVSDGLVELAVVDDTLNSLNQKLRCKDSVFRKVLLIVIDHHTEIMKLLEHHLHIGLGDTRFACNCLDLLKG